MENKQKEKAKSILFVTTLVLILLSIILYFNYKMNTGKYFEYKDEILGEVLQDETARNISYVVLIGLSIYSLLIIIYIKDKYKKGSIKIENIFLLVVPMFCIFFTLAMPMSKGHDETIHGLRIYEYAEGKFISNGEKAYLEEGVIRALDNKDSYYDIYQNSDTYNKNTEKIEWGYRVAGYSPINYLPQVIGTFISRFFTSNSIIHLYVARLFNIITCIALIYFAIKIIPFGKNLFFLLSMIPITIEGFSTLSADGMLVSASFLWIAYILFLTFTKERNICKKDILLLSVLAITISLSKTIYVTILPFIFIIPKEKWKNNKIRIVTCSIIILISAILDVLWLKLGIQGQETTLDNNTLSFVTAPINYIQKLIYTIIKYFDKYLTELFGAKLEWNETITIYLFPYILLFSSVILSFTGKEKINWSLIQKIIITIIILACVFMVFTSLYLTWSNSNANYIDGVQGRYFTPILPLIILLFARKYNDSKKETLLISSIGLIMQVYVIMEIVLPHM